MGRVQFHMPSLNNPRRGTFLGDLVNRELVVGREYIAPRDKALRP